MHAAISSTMPGSLATRFQLVCGTMVWSDVGTLHLAQALLVRVRVLVRGASVTISTNHVESPPRPPLHSTRKEDAEEDASCHAGLVSPRLVSPLPLYTIYCAELDSRTG